MRLLKLACLTAVIVTCPNLILGDSITTSGSPTCVTITETIGSTCPSLAGACLRPDCIELQVITLECGCPSIFSTTICPTICPRGCATSYNTIYLPCANSPTQTPIVTTTSLSSSSPVSSNSAPTTSASVSSNLTPNPTSTPPSTSTIIIYPNSTGTSTSSSISLLTITSCPALVTCTGQTTSFTGTTGSLTCATSSTCSVVLPGGVSMATETSVTTPGNTPPTPTAAASGSSSPVHANEGSRGSVYRFGIVEGGVLVGLIGAVLGML